jgi:polyvinyl alcohol dehydrogenase (cytochrome)
MKAIFGWLGAVAGLMLVSAPQGVAAQSVGETIYRQNCASGHENPDTRAPSKASLAAVEPQAIACALSDGKLLWRDDTARGYQGINGVAGKGGAIEAASITAANGRLLVNSGYGMSGEQAGDVLLAFRPKR